MRQTIYVDILISVNLIVNYFLLLATARFLYIKYSKFRIFLGSILGAAFSLYIFFPELNFLLTNLIKFLMALAIILASFPIVSFSKFVKTVLCFFLINFSFSGIIFAIWLAFSPRGIIVNNNVVYFGISPIVLVISTVIAYTIFKAINIISGKYIQRKNFFKIGLAFLGKDAEFTAKIDTGNTLKETFSGLPVVIVKKSDFEKYYGNFMLKINKFLNCSNLNLDVKFRLIPYKTILGDGVLPAFKPDYVYFIEENKKVKKNAYVAVSENFVENSEFDALINCELLS